MNLAEILPKLLCIAWLLPLASFALIVFFGPRMGKKGVLASYVATGAIVGAFLLSATSFCLWIGKHGTMPPAAHHEATTEHHAAVPSPFRNVSLAVDPHDHTHGDHAHHATPPPVAYTDN